MQSQEKPTLTSSVVTKVKQPVEYVGNIPQRYRRHIRNKAIERAKTRILVAGNDPKNMSQQDLEIVVREEEDKIKSAVKERGLIMVLAFFGISLFG